MHIMWVDIIHIIISWTDDYIKLHSPTQLFNFNSDWHGLNWLVAPSWLSLSVKSDICSGHLILPAPPYEDNAGTSYSVERWTQATSSYLADSIDVVTLKLITMYTTNSISLNCSSCSYSSFAPLFACLVNIFCLLSITKNIVIVQTFVTYKLYFHLRIFLIHI